MPSKNKELSDGLDKVIRTFAIQPLQKMVYRLKMATSLLAHAMDVMSLELPVVALGVCDAHEAVGDMKTAILVKRSLLYSIWNNRGNLGVKSI